MTILTRSARRIAIPALALLAACGDAPPPATWAGSIDTLDSGVIRVANPETGLWAHGDGWRLVEELRIGSALEEGPAMFGNIVALAVSPDGRIYVADSQAQEVRAFGPDGAHVRTFGRKGGGPGEFEQITGMGWGPGGDLWIMDTRNSRFTVYDASGRHVADHGRPGGFVMMPWPGGFDRDGGIYDVGMAPGKDGRFRTSLIRYAFLGEAGIEPRDTFPIPRYDGPAFTIRDSEGRTRVSAGIPYTHGVVWRLANGRIWTGVTDRYRLHQLSFDGDTLRTVERAFTPAPVTAAEKDTALARMTWFTDQGGRVDRSRVPDTKPAFATMMEDDAGYLWVWPQQPADEPHALDVFDPEGRYLGRAEVPQRIGFIPWPVIQGDRFYAIVRDELDIQYVARFRLEGRDRRLAAE